MNPVATVRYIANGYILTIRNAPPGTPETRYVATLEEVIFYIDQLFNPPPP
jgi:hypothetical protein